MTDTRNLGLGELGQRVQAMGDPVIDSRLRPYQGASTQSQPANGRPDSSLESFSSIPTTPAPVPPSQRSIPQPPVQSQASQPSQSAAPLPYSPSKAESATAWQSVPQPAPVSASATPPPPAGLPAPATSHEADPNAPKSGLHRALDAIRSTLPLVQKLLPIIDGNFATAVSAIMASRPHPTPAPLPAPLPPPQPPQIVQVDLEPIERGLAEVRNSHRELRGQVQEQVTTLKRVEDQLDRVREATDRNTLEQQELVEDLRSVGNRLGRFAVIGLVFLLVSLGLNIYLIFQLQHILH